MQEALRSAIRRLLRSELVVDKRSIGINLMSLVAHLKMVCLVPIGKIRILIETLCGVSISNGEISELLSAVSETGWRENGVNGYLWSCSRLRLCATSRITTLEAGRL